MLFKYSIKLYFLLSIIIIFTLNTAHAKKSKKFKKPKKNNDNFYIVITENDSGNGINKREEKEQFLDALVTEINNLIIGNKDTYDDPSILNELEEAPAPETPFTKRSVIKDEKEDEDDDEDDNGEEEPENKFAYVISSLEDESLIYSYLSEDLVPLVKDLPSVKTVLPDFELDLSSDRNKHLKEIKETYKWEHPCVKGNTFHHLSLISQDKFDDSNNSTTYDENYYYPNSAGEGINIFILDSGFNFNHDEFSNRSTRKEKKERTATCIASTRYKRLYYQMNSICRDSYDEGHGNIVADIAAGLTNGVASKANIYGIAIQSSQDDVQKVFVSSLIQGLELINSRYLNETIPENVDNFIHKSVINLSSGYFFTEQEKLYVQEKKNFTDYLGQLISDMSNKGAVFVAAAGNYHTNVDEINFYPCSFDDVICVGSTDNIGINDDYNAVDDLLKLENNTSIYPNHDEWKGLVDKAKSRYFTNLDKYFENKFVVSKSYSRAHFSNYGKKVDIYAPGYVKALFIDQNDVKQEMNKSGTSFSSPIVAGVAATIMSERPYIKYTSKEMKKELQEIGLRDILQDVKVESPNIFINNGKHLRYNYDNDEEDDEDLAELECYRHGCCLRS